MLCDNGSHKRKCVDLKKMIKKKMKSGPKRKTNRKEIKLNKFYYSNALMLLLLPKELRYQGKHLVYDFLRN